MATKIKPTVIDMKFRYGNRGKFIGLSYRNPKKNGKFTNDRIEKEVRAKQKEYKGKNVEFIVSIYYDNLGITRGILQSGTRSTGRAFGPDDSFHVPIEYDGVSQYGSSQFNIFVVPGRPTSGGDDNVIVGINSGTGEVEQLI